MTPQTYRDSGRAKCACSALLDEAPLLSPSRGVPVCSNCYHAEVRLPAETLEARASGAEALRHMAIELTRLSEPKRDPRLDRVSKCRSCGANAHIVALEAGGGDLPMGTIYDHACEKCGAKFTTESTYATIAKTLGAGLVAAFAYGFWFSSGTRNNVIAAALALFTAGILALRVIRVRNRWFARPKGT